MKKFKFGRYKVILFAAAIILAGAGVLLTFVTVAQGAEENRIVAEQSENAGLYQAPAETTETVTPDSTPVQAAETEPATTETPSPAVTSAVTPGPEFITEKEAEEAYTQIAKELFGLKVNSKKLAAEFHPELAPHEWWIITGPDAQASIDAISGGVLMFSINDNKKYTGKKITLDEYENDPAYSYKAYEDPNNPYSKLAAKIVKSKLAEGRVIDEVVVSASQFAWDDNNGGSKTSAKGTTQVDVCVFMKTGRCYTLSFWGTKQLELRIFSSYPTKDACLNGYFYEEEASSYSPEEALATPLPMPTPTK